MSLVVRNEVSSGADRSKDKTQRAKKRGGGSPNPVNDGMRPKLDRVVRGVLRNPILGKFD